MLGKLAEYTLAAVLLVLSVSLLFGYVLGQPALLAFVETGSMEPTLNAGDGFVAVPAAVAGTPSTGDVVVFQAEQINGGRLTTHRIVDDRESGYITQGDANPFTDQGRNEPPVTEGQIKAVTLEINGDVVRIPHLGTAVMGMQALTTTAERSVSGLFGTSQLGTDQFSYLLFGLGTVVFISALLFGDEGRQRKGTSRSRRRTGVFNTKTVIGGAVLLIVLSTTMAMVVPGGTETYTIISSEGGSDRADIVPVGGSSEVTIPVHNGGFIPVISYQEPASTGVEIEPHRSRIAGNETINTTATFHAPSETGLYTRSITEHRYLLVLPPSVIDLMYRLHPWIPYVVVNAVVGSSIAGLGVVLTGGSNKVRLRSRNRRGSGMFGWLL